MLAAALVSGALLSGGAGAQEVREPWFGVQVEMVSLFATVEDRSGRLVTGLGPDDFIIFDNGVPQKISQFTREYVPLSVVILLDSSASMRGKKLENARRALAQFLRRLRPGDEAMLVTFQTRPQVVQAFTGRLDLIRSALRRLDGIGSTALYDAIIAALEHAESARNRRRSLLLISDGVNNYGRAKLPEATTRLRRSGLELFAIGIESNLPEDFEERAVTRAVLDQLTRAAGGEAFIVAESRQLPEVSASISYRMHNQYTFGYYPPPSRDAEWRTVRLETRVPVLKVIASKTGYYPAIAPKFGRPSAPVP